MQFLHQVLVQDEAITASTQRTDDLPVNPLSVIWVTIRNLNDTGTLTNYDVVALALAQIARMEVLYQGSAIVSGSAADLARMNGVLVGRGPRTLRQVDTNNDIRGVTFPILLGRKPFWPEECFPAVRRGELQLQTTFAAAQTGLDTMTLQIETDELLGATPNRYVKYTTISKTPAATGDHDIDLPIGNRIAGLLLFGTTVPTSTSFNASFGQSRLLVDNVEAYFARANWESLQGMLQLRTQSSPQNSEHIHLTNTAALYTQNSDTDLNQVSADFFDQYAFMDMDPHCDSQWLLETKGRARIHLRVNADVADAVRVLPLEIVNVGG